MPQSFGGALAPPRPPHSDATAYYDSLGGKGTQAFHQIR